jgi:hypothetical protein
MLVISYSIPKSGSTLAFQLAMGVAVLGGHWQPKLAAGLRLPGVPLPLALPFAEGFPHIRPPRQGWRDRWRTLRFQWAALRAAGLFPRTPRVTPALGLADLSVCFVQSLEAEALPRLVDAAGEGLFLVKTHAAPDERWLAAYARLAAQGLARVHVTRRDPRDICLALLDAGRINRARGAPEFREFETLEGAVARVRGYLAEAARWQGAPHVLELDYETCAFRPEAAIAAIQADLGVTCDAGLLAHYALRLAFTQRNRAEPQRHVRELGEAERRRLEEVFGGEGARSV